MRRGRCKWFNVLKGWGFIAPEDGSQEVFVHQVMKIYTNKKLNETFFLLLTECHKNEWISLVR